MDPGGYGLHQQRWDNNSAPEGYGAADDPNFRAGGSYDDRRFIDERFSRDNIYPRTAYHDDLVDRETYAPPPPAVGAWPQRRRTYEEEYPHDRDSRSHERSYDDSYRDMDAYRETDRYHDINTYQELDKFRDGSRSSDSYHDHGYDKPVRFGGRDRDRYAYDEYENRPRIPHQNREDSRERDYECGRRSYDSDNERGSSKDSNWRRHDSRDRERDKKCLSRDRDQSPYRNNERSRSRGHDDRLRSRSPRVRSRSRSHREDSYEAGRHDRGEKRRDRGERYQHEHSSVAQSATVVVRGLSQKTTEEDLYQILTDWAPLRHVRIIRDRNSGLSRGFAFLDFPSAGAAHAMMDKLGEDGLVVDDRKLFFEYSSKPTGGMGEAFGQEKSTYVSHRNTKPPSDWMCTICGCVNFARRTSCFQCSERRTEDAPPADMSLSNSTQYGRKGFESGPTHVLVVRGLDENADEEVLRYEFSKHAPIKDLRLVRDKFTHVSRGFAFVHFHSVEDATKTLESTNGTTLEKNGQILRVAYAKSILGPLSGSSSQSSSLAAAAIEAATFSQQYDAVGWAPKEYNPDEKQSMVGQEQSGGELSVQRDGSAPHSGFVWDEASGYYYDSSSGFYYDGNTGLYYDGNNRIWYTYDHQTQQYMPCTDQNDNKTNEKESDSSSKASDGSNNRKVVISAPAATITSNEKAASLPDAVQAAAEAAIAAEKKEKEKLKEIRLASKSSILANKKKMSNVLTMWKQRSHEGGQAKRVALDENSQLATANEKQNSSDISARNNYFKANSTIAKESGTYNSEIMTNSSNGHSDNLESLVKPRPVMGVIRGSVKLDNSYSGQTAAGPPSSQGSSSTTIIDMPPQTPFRTDASALGAYAPQVTPASGRRRFSETPVQSASSLKEQSQTTYRDRAAERRNLYGSSSSVGDNSSELGMGDSNRELASRSMPFPPGVGGGRGSGDASSNIESYEVITADKAIDENNLGNRMLRNMGWHEGSGLGKDGSGMVEPVQAQSSDRRAGLGSSKQKKLDPGLEVQAGDSYRTLIQKKSLARFRDMC